MTPQARPLATLLVNVFFASLPAWGEDWPGWRGPARDGGASGVLEVKEWPKSLVVEWRVVVGEGHASPVLLGER